MTAERRTLALRLHSLWLAGRLGAVFATCGVALEARRLPAAMVVAFLFAGPAALLGLAEWLRGLVLRRSRLGVPRSSVAERLRRQASRLNGWRWACVPVWAFGLPALLLTCPAAAWAGMFMQRRRRRRRSAAARPVDPSTLPPGVRALLAREHGVRVFTGPIAIVGSDSAEYPDTIYLTERSLAGESGELCSTVAHEVAHLHQFRHGWRRHARWLWLSALDGVPMWAGAVLLGAMPAQLGIPSPRPAFIPAVAGLAAGFMLADAVKEPILLHRARRRELDADRRSFDLTGDTDAFVSSLSRTMTSIAARPLLYATHPSPERRLRQARTYARSPLASSAD
jgi:hypothetical protein